MARILIVDDQRDNLDLARYILQAAGHTVEIFEEGQEAILAHIEAREQGQPFDLLILDVAMPHLNGYEIAEQMRAAGDTETPIVFYSAHHDKESMAVDDWPPSYKIVRSLEPHVMLPDLQKVMEKHNIPFTAAPYQSGQAMPTPLMPKMPVRSGDDMVPTVAERRGRAPLWANVMIVLLAALSITSAIQTYRSQYSFRMIAQTYSHVSQQTGGTSAVTFRATVPPVKSAHTVLSDGRARITFEVSADDAQKLERLANERGRGVVVSVGR